MTIIGLLQWWVHCSQLTHLNIFDKLKPPLVATTIEFQSDDVTKMILLKLWGFFFNCLKKVQTQKNGSLVH